MGVNCKIFLESSASPNEIIQVIFKVLGLEGKKIPLVEDYPSNSIFFENPSAKGNCWIYKIKNHTLNVETDQSLEYFKISFFDNFNNSFFFLLFTEDPENTGFKYSKQLAPNSDTIWCLLGTRLVDFFGGKILYNDYFSFDDGKSYLCSNPKLTPLKPEENVDRRFYDFHNLLFNEPAMNYAEFLNFKSKSANSTEKDDSLEKNLRIISKKEEISKILPIKNKNEIKRKF